MIEYFENSLYTHFLLYCSLGIALYVTQKSDRSNIRRYFLLYLWSMVIVEIIAIWGSITSTFERFSMPVVAHTVNISFSIIEFLSLGLFFNATLRNKKVSIILYRTVILQILGLMIFLYYTTQNFPALFFIRFGNIFYSLELFILASICIYYLIVFSRTPEETNLKTTPNFWIVTGLFFYCIMSIPFCLISTEIVSLNKLLFTYLISIHFIFLSIFFILIAKAFLCKKEFQTY